MAKTPFHYNVNPRYTAGSPAMVDQATAEKVAAEERHFIQHALEGVWGAEERTRAQRLGLRPSGETGVKRSIAEEVWEHAGHWMVRDLLTGEIYQRQMVGMRAPHKPCNRCVAAKERAALQMEEV